VLLKIAIRTNFISPFITNIASKVLKDNNEKLETKITRKDIIDEYLNFSKEDRFELLCKLPHNIHKEETNNSQPELKIQPQSQQPPTSFSYASIARSAKSLPAQQPVNLNDKYAELYNKNSIKKRRSWADCESDSSSSDGELEDESGEYFIEENSSDLDMDGYNSPEDNENSSKKKFNAPKYKIVKSIRDLNTSWPNN
jgi:hypothetical protein